MLFNNFVHEENLKNKATSNRRRQQVLSSFSLNKLRIFLRVGPFPSDVVIVNLHLSKGTHWVCYINKNYFDSYGCAPPKELSKFIIKRNEHCLCSEYKIKGLTSTKDNNYASYCLYISFLTKMVGMDFKSAVLNLYYRRLFIY